MAAASPLPDQKRTESCQEQVAATIGGHSIRFTRASARLTSEDIALVRKVGSLVAEACGDKKILVDGYTDADGSDRFNKRLSLKRATAVARAMGVADAAGHVVVEGLGKADPVAANDSRIHKAMNRRVEIRTQ